MRKRFSIRLLLACAATFHILNASASREVEAVFERSCAHISTDTRRAASRDGGVGTAHGKPQPNGRKRLGSQYRGAPSGKCDGSTGNHYTKKDDIFVRMGKKHRLSVDEWQIGNTQYDHPAGKLRSCPPGMVQSAALPPMLSPQFHKDDDKIKLSKAERAELMARSRR